MTAAEIRQSWSLDERCAQLRSEEAREPEASHAEVTARREWDAMPLPKKLMLGTGPFSATSVQREDRLFRWGLMFGSVLGLVIGVALGVAFMSSAIIAIFA